MAYRFGNATVRIAVTDEVRDVINELARGLNCTADTAIRFLLYMSGVLDVRAKNGFLKVGGDLREEFIAKFICGDLDLNIGDEDDAPKAPSAAV